MLWPLSTGLPVAGVTGTLAERFSTAGTDAGRGVVRAKTGTLTGVDALAGLMRDAEGGCSPSPFSPTRRPARCATPDGARPRGRRRRAG